MSIFGERGTSYRKEDSFSDKDIGILHCEGVSSSCPVHEDTNLNIIWVSQSITQILSLLLSFLYKTGRYFLYVEDGCAFRVLIHLQTLDSESSELQIRYIESHLHFPGTWQLLQMRGSGIFTPGLHPRSVFRGPLASSWMHGSALYHEVAWTCYTIQ